MAARTPVKAILWDVGGTLVVPACPQAESVRRRLAAAGCCPAQLGDDAIERTFGAFIRHERTWRTPLDEQAAVDAWAADLLRGHAVDASALAAAGQCLAAYESMFCPVPGITGLLADLRSVGLRQVIVSNWPPSLPRFLSHHGLDRLVDAVVFSAEDGVHKPDPAIYHRGLRAAGVPPAEAVFIGDHPEWDVAGPRAVGVRAIHFDPRRRHAARDADEVVTLRRLVFDLLDGG